MKTDKDNEKPRSHHKAAGKGISPPDKVTGSEEPAANGNPVEEPLTDIAKQFAQDAVEAAELVLNDEPIKVIKTPPTGARIGLIFRRTSATKGWPQIMAEIRTSVYRGCLDKGMDIEADDFRMFVITMPCGCSATYKRFRDLPLEDTPCECGLAWLVKYIEQIPCSICKGSGKSNLYQGVIQGTCRACGGTGIEKVTHAIRGDNGPSDSGNRDLGRMDPSPGSGSVPSEPEQP